MTRPTALPCLSLAVLALCASGGAQQFTYVPGVLPAQSAWTDGVAIADVDGDDDLDILFANAGGTGLGSYGAGIGTTQHLYLNNGGGMFTAAHGNLGLGSVATRMVIVEDIDGDGDPDVLYARDSGWPSPTAPPIVLINDGSGVFTDESAARIPAGFLMTGFGICAGDIENDGDLDIVLTNGGTFNGVATQARLLVNDGDGFFTHETSTRLPTETFNGNDVTMLDVDNDFDIDIVISGKGGATIHSRLYLNDGTGVFSASTALNNVGTSGTYETDFADFDGDSDFDMVVQSIASSMEGWARNDGPSTPWVKTTFPGSVNQDDNEMGTFDYDNDGDLDVLVGSLASSERIYTNTAGVFALANGVIQAQNDSTLDLAIADLNGDGRHDIVTAQGESGNFLDKVYLNGGPADTLPPVFKLVETPASVAPAGDTIFRARVQDSVSEDGHVNVTMTYSYFTTGGDEFSAIDEVAVPQGGGQFRAAVPAEGATGIALTWTATDSAGNVSRHGPVLVGTGSPWSDLGSGLPGSLGHPTLIATGTLLPATAASITLLSARPSSPAMLFVAAASMPIAFKGGTLVPVPFLLTLSLTTSPSGSIPLAFPWPAGLSGLDLHFQWAIVDPVAVQGVSLSNALKADVP